MLIVASSLCSKSPHLACVFVMHMCVVHKFFFSCGLWKRLKSCRKSLLWCLCLFSLIEVQKHSREHLNTRTTGEDANSANNLQIFPAVWCPSVQLIDSPILQKSAEKSNTTKKSHNSVCVHNRRIFPLNLRCLFLHVILREAAIRCSEYRPFLKSTAAGVLFIRPQCFEKYKSLQKVQLITNALSHVKCFFLIT